MLQVSQDILTTITSSGREWRSRLVFDGLTIDTIKDFNVDIGNTELQIGGTNSAVLEVPVYGKFTGLKDKDFALELDLKVGDVWETIPLGKFTVRSATIETDLTVIEANDFMYKFERAYKTQLDFPASVEDVSNEMLEFFGLEFEGKYPTDKFVLFTPIGYSMREMLGVCASLQGKNAYFNRNGKLVYKFYENANFSVTDDTITDPKFFNDSYSIDYLEVEAETETFISGDKESETGIFLKTQFIPNQGMVDSAFETISGFTFQPSEIYFRLGNPLLDPWDVIQYKEYNIPCMSLNYYFDGGLDCTLETYVQDTSKEYSTPAEREQERQDETIKNNNIVLDNFNKDLVEFGTNKNLITIDFTTKEENLPIFEFTGQLEISKESVTIPQPTFDEETGLYTFPTITADMIFKDVNIIFDVILDGSIIEQFKSTENGGFRIVSFIIPLKNLHQGGHTLSVEAYTENAEQRATIQAGESRGVIWGDGLLSVAQWNGILDITQSFGFITLDNLDITLRDTVTNISKQIPLPSNVTQGLGIINVNNFNISLIDSLEMQIETVLESYVVTFDPQGGTVVPTQIVTIGTLKYFPDAEYEGYTLKGWYTLPDGGEQITLETVFTQDTTVYAQWQEPTEYTYLDSIQSTGTQFIDTGFAQMAEAIIEITFSEIQNVSNAGFVGVYDNGNRTFLYGTKNTFYVGIGGGYTTIYVPQTPTKITINTKDLTYSINDGTAKKLGTAVKASSQTYHLCKIEIDGYAMWKIHEYKLSTPDGTVLQHLKPVMRNADNAVGMKDEISGNFFGNDGTGEFIAGQQI